MSLDTQALQLLRKHGPRLRLSLECFPNQEDEAFQVDVYSPENEEWVTVATSHDPAQAIVDALSIADETVSAAE